MSAPLPQSLEPGGQLVFSCPECGVKLSVSLRLGGVAGPCPSCAVAIAAPAAAEAQSDGEMASSIMPSATAARQSRSGASRTTKGHVRADSNVDHEYMNRRENLKTLRILLMFVLAICACLSVAWILKVLMAK